MKQIFDVVKFESIWIAENKDHVYGEARKLSDDEYIEYKIWEDINWAEMYYNHLPNTKVSRGKNPNIIFHGGCLGCLSQRKHGIDRCKGCSYFKFDNDKQSLFIPGEDSARMSAQDLEDLFN